MRLDIGKGLDESCRRAQAGGFRRAAKARAEPGEMLDRRRRLWQSFAGPWFEFVCAGVFALTLAAFPVASFSPLLWRFCAISYFVVLMNLVPLLERIQADESLPIAARELFSLQAKGYAQLQAQIDEVDARLMAWHRADECSRRLTKIPGVGPIGAVLLTMKTPEPELFRSGRQFAAWIGLTPKDHSTAGKVRLGGISKRGDRYVRTLLVGGARSVMFHLKDEDSWLGQLKARKHANVAVVAQAAKTARTIWALVAKEQPYQAGHQSVRPVMA